MAKTFNHPPDVSRPCDTAGLRVGDAAHEQNAAATLVAQEDQERSVDVESNGSGRVSTATSVAHADRRRSTSLCAFHVHLDDRQVLGDINVQIARADARENCRRDEHVGPAHGLEVNESVPGYIHILYIRMVECYMVRKLLLKLTTHNKKWGWVRKQQR